MRKLFAAVCFSLSWLSAAESAHDLKPPDKYKLGMMMTEARKLFNKPYRAIVSGKLVDEDFPVTDKQREEEARFLIRVEDENIELYFNWNHKLIRIEKIPLKK